MSNKNHLQYGLIISAVLIVLSVLFYVLGMSEQRWTQWVGTVVMFIGVILACINYAKVNDGNVTFGNVFANGFKTVSIITLITIVFTVIFVLIFPDIREKALETARRQMEEQGQSDEAIENAMALSRRMFFVFVIAFTLFGTLFFGAIASLIGAAVAKKNPHIQPPQA
jgi:uncharacterized membrane protein